MAEQEPGDGRRGAIAGLIIAIVLLAVGVWLARDLTAASKMQDCVMSGRSDVRFAGLNPTQNCRDLTDL